MGVWFNDPDVEMDEIIWYNILATEIFKSDVLLQEGLISKNEEFGTASCYAELLRSMLDWDFFSKISQLSNIIY